MATIKIERRALEFEIDGKTYPADLTAERLTTIAELRNASEGESYRSVERVVCELVPGLPTGMDIGVYLQIVRHIYMQVQEMMSAVRPFDKAPSGPSGPQPDGSVRDFEERSGSTGS